MTQNEDLVEMKSCVGTPMTMLPRALLLATDLFELREIG